MSKPAKVITLRQKFGWYIAYEARSGEKRHLSGSIFAAHEDMVDAYFRRKFSRVAKSVIELSIWDEGMTAEEDGLLQLTLQDNGVIIASVAQTGEFACQEPPPGRVSETTIESLVKMNPHQYPVPYTNSTTSTTYEYKPKEVFPSLATYTDAFDVVAYPKELHARMSSNKFQAKFYDVFPREK